jgi:HNH endonuclease
MSAAFPKQGGRVGRRGLPDDWVWQMWQDYQRLGSLGKVAKLHQRTRQNMYGIFKGRGLKLNAKTFLPIVKYKGMNFTAQKVCGRHRYLRETSRRKGTTYLHHVVWEEHHGPVPRGFKVCFKDGNHMNWDISNLELLSNSEQPRKHATGANQFTKTARGRLNLLLKNHQGNRRTVAARLKR